MSKISSNSFLIPGYAPRLIDQEQEQQASLSDSEEVIDVNYIIENKPENKVVRKFLKDNLASIVDSDEEGFI